MRRPGADSLNGFELLRLLPGARYALDAQAALDLQLAVLLQSKREVTDCGRPGPWPIAQQCGQAQQGVPLRRGSQESLVRYQLLVEGQDVAEICPQIQQRNSVVAAVACRPASQPVL